MQYIVVDKGEYPTPEKETICFRRDNWDDFGYKTSFDVYFYYGQGLPISLGPVKIACINMAGNRTFDIIPKSFNALPKDFVSLGQSEQYYENINKLGSEFRDQVLTELNDIAFNLEYYTELSSYRVIKDSLLRGVTDYSLRYQLNRIAHGGARLTKFHFSYSSTQSNPDMDFSPINLEFKVSPGSTPPTNVHVLIGRNGTGKTKLIKNMINSIRSDDCAYGRFGYADTGAGYANAERQFANILCVAFSPFDDFSDMSQSDSTIPYTYIGLDKTSANLLENIEKSFFDNFSLCMADRQKRSRWLDVIEVLNSDPMFAESNIELFASSISDDINHIDAISDYESEIKTAFSQLSSGHKVTLLIITCCVNNLAEKSIVFMDEPENHLHPPLLASFIRAMSKLLIDRNGVAIISTHSPVVLQEVPKNCVWSLRRSGHELTAERLAVESFGASIGTLTRQVFGLEVTKSGFHKLLIDSVKKNADYDYLLQFFNDQLGDEAKAILFTLIAIIKNGGTIE